MARTKVNKHARERPNIDRLKARCTATSPRDDRALHTAVLALERTAGHAAGSNNLVRRVARDALDGVERVLAEPRGTLHVLGQGAEAPE